MFNPKYRLTNKILANLTAIAEAKGIVERAKILPQQEVKLRRQAIIRITHHSTEIEGNQLNIGQVEALYAKKKIDAPDRDIYEVKNYLNALKFIEKTVAEKQPITEKIILKIHKLVTDKTLNKKILWAFSPRTNLRCPSPPRNAPRNTLYRARSQTGAGPSKRLY